MASKKKKKQERAAPPPEPQAPEKKRKTATIACAGCAGLFVVAIIVGIIWLTAWDTKDSRLYDGKPIPENVAYIGRWVGDDVISARIDTFAITGDKIACDFAIRNDSPQDITVNAIGRTIIAPPLDSRMSANSIPLNLMDGDLPMKVTDDENVLGLQLAMGGMWLIIDPGEAEDAPPPEPFTLKPGEVKRFRYRPRAHQLIMPASALRIAVLLDDGEPPHPFYFLRQSSGIGGWFEKGAEKAIEAQR